MNSIEVLDVSLRDGGHRTNFHFKPDELSKILSALDQSGLEYIEIGYRNGSIHPIENLGSTGLCPKEYLFFCKEHIKNTKMAVMAHPKNITRFDLKELKTCGVDLLRICVKRGGLNEACPLITMAKQQNLMVSVNLIHASQYTELELNDAVKQASLYDTDMIYFADSNGSLLPDDVKVIYEQFTKQFTIPFGFHAHDNLGLAQANALAAMQAGAKYIDASLAGMGKGIGNLKTEFFTAYLHSINIKKYNLDQILLAANYVRDTLDIGREPIEIDEFTRGIFDLSTAEMKQLKI